MLKNTILKGVIILILSCNSNKPGYFQKVMAPIPEYDIPFKSFSVDADSIFSIQTETGTKLQFQASSFETASGQSVKGKIEIKVREFHTANDLLRAGIPLTIDETRKEVLQSAGMVEVHAFQKGQELKLRSGKSAEVELAGFRPSDGYRLYHLGDDVRWKVKDSFISIPNARRKLVKSSISKTDSIKDAGFEIAADLKEVPYLIPFKGLTWEVVGSKQKKSQMEAAMRIHWDSVKVFPVDRKHKRYQLKFSKTIYSEQSDPEKKEWIVFATPKLNGKSVQKIIQEEERIALLIKEEEIRLSKQAEMVNRFRINQMGIWNIDKIMKWENTQTISVDFDFASQLDVDFHAINVYMILEEANSVIPILSSELSKVLVPKDHKFHFMAMLPGGKAVVCGSGEVEKWLKSGKTAWKLPTRLANKSDLGI